MVVIMLLNQFPIEKFLISYLYIFVKSDEDIFIAVSKIDRHFKASYFSVYKLKRLRKIEKICVYWNVRNYQFLIFDESCKSNPENENDWMKNLVDPDNFSYEERFVEIIKHRFNYSYKNHIDENDKKEECLESYLIQD